METSKTPELLRRLLEGEGLGTPYVGAYATEARAPEFLETSHPIHPFLKQRLEEIGIESLFAHQALAFDAVIEGRDVTVVTGTNSGKSLCYMLPAFEALLAEPAARVLAVFPTKALAQDQLQRFESLRPWQDLHCAVYDGDTPKTQRSPIRKAAQVVLTNPDMLHVGILPSHQAWSRLFKSLRLIVLDELHVYRGVFGSHVASIVRRLLRLCAWYGSRPTIVACSATIGNPGELFETITGRPSRVIDRDGSSQPRKTYALWNPAATQNASPSPNWMTARLWVRLAAEQKRALAFCRSRIGAELVLRYGRELAQQQGKPKPEQLDSYRAGYSASERRRLEKSIHDGKVLGLACTNAMELGVDIGELDGVLLNGYPGSVASFRQQCGRAGRGQREGMAIYIAHEDPLEQYFVRDPQSLILGNAERVALNPGNPNILEQQLRCAAYERPLDPSELENFGPHSLDTAEAMDRAGTLAFQSGRFFYPFHEAPAPKVDIRGAGGESVTLLADEEELGQMEKWRAVQYAHEGAVYLHRGATFQVTELDLASDIARLESFSGPYFTQPVLQSVLDPLVTVNERRLGSLSLCFGSIRVTDMVLGYRKKSLDGDKVLDTIELDLPPSTFETMGLRIDLPRSDSEEGWPLLAPQVHGLEHALTAIAPLLAGCDRNDLGSAWYVAFPDTLAPAVYLFDRFAGGMGLAEKLFASADELFETARRALAGCNCEGGCPKCLYSSRCEISNDALSKAGALAYLEAVFSPAN